MMDRVWGSGCSGWYYRVLEPGIAGPDDVFALIERLYLAWFVRRLADVRFAPILDRPALVTWPVCPRSRLTGVRGRPDV